MKRPQGAHSALRPGAMCVISTTALESPAEPKADTDFRLSHVVKADGDRQGAHILEVTEGPTLHAHGHTGSPRPGYTGSRIRPWSLWGVRIDHEAYDEWVRRGRPSFPDQATIREYLKEFAQ